MILGLGVDLVEVARIERAVDRHGEDFLGEFLGPAELDWCRQSTRPHLAGATLFAAKEAFFKALGTGRSGRLRWHDLEVIPGRGPGDPIRLSGETKRRAEDLGLARVHLSTAATRGGAGVACACVVLEAEGSGARPEYPER